DADCVVDGAQSSQDISRVVAFTASGRPAWVTPLPAGCSADALVVDGARGRIYTAASCPGQTGQAQPHVYALDVTGRLRWAAHGRRGVPALALDRRSGDLWLADS